MSKTKTKHTPGPWKANGKFIISACDTLVASTVEMQGSNLKRTGELIEQAATNAKLISAAPEMYALLIVLLDTATGKDLERIKYMLAKAKGDL